MKESSVWSLIFARNLEPNGLGLVNRTNRKITVPFVAWNTRNFKPEYLVEWKAPTDFLGNKTRTFDCTWSGRVSWNCGKFFVLAASSKSCFRSMFFPIFPRSSMFPGRGSNRHLPTTVLVFRVKSGLDCCILIVTAGSPDGERYHQLSSSERYDTGHHSCDENPQRSWHKCPGGFWSAIHVRSEGNWACWEVRQLFVRCLFLSLLQSLAPVGEYFVAN